MQRRRRNDKKDYIKVANALCGMEVNETFLEVLRRLAEAFKNNNARFNKVRFFEACGVIKKEE